LAEIIIKKVNELIMLPGTASEKMKENLSGYNKMHEVPSMQEAVKKAKELAQVGDIVALSPGAASFNLFKNEFDRGSQFVKAVKDLK
jgi:UDP-N-acetylmuramoylalanine--D-glutamate ligase